MFVQFEPNPDHKRAKLVRLSTTGRAVMKELGQRQSLWANRIAANAPEIEAALALLRHLRQRLEADPPSPANASFRLKIRPSSKRTPGISLPACA